MPTRTLVATLIEVMVALLQPLLLMLVATLLRWLRARHVDARVTSALDEGTGAVGRAVAAVAQTVVNDLKDPSKPGTWSKVAAATAKASAVRIALSTLSAQTRATLDAHCGGAEAWCDVAVESELDARKRTPPP